MRPPLPWDAVETLPSIDAEQVATWQALLDRADSPAERAWALTGRALVAYWSVQAGVTHRSWQEQAEQQAEDTTEAVRLARTTDDPNVLSAALLGSIYSRWGPDHLERRAGLLDELEAIRPGVTDLELRLHGREQRVLHHLDHGDADAAHVEIERYRGDAGPQHAFAHRRAQLWVANLAMLAGRIDDAVELNQSAVSSTADTAGSPFSFQNVAITLAIERFLRRGLDDLIDAIRSIRASSSRVAVNWDVGLAFAYAETDQLDEARAIFDRVAADRFAPVPRDLNWLVTVQLLGLVAIRLGDQDAMAVLVDALAPFAHLDGTHGAGYASYGPVGRVSGVLLAQTGRAAAGLQILDEVLATRSPGPWTSLTRLDRASLRADSDPTGGRADAERADLELSGFGLTAWAREARDLVDRLDLGGVGRPIAYEVGGRWTLRHRSGQATISGGIGVDELCHLLARPGQTVDATDLDVQVDPSLPTQASTSEHLDATAQRAYRRRLDELTRSTKPLRDRERAEIESLQRELAADRHRPSSSAELERARVRVTKAIRRAIATVGAEAPALGEHLRSSVETGRRCLYAPADGTAWRIVRSSAGSSDGPPAGA